MKPLLALLLGIAVAQAVALEVRRPAADEIREARLTAEVDLDDAESLIKSTIKTFPDNAEAHLACGEIMGRQAADAIFSALSYAKKSLNCLRRASQLSPEAPRYRRALITFYLVAPGIAGGGVDLAKQEIEALHELSPLEADKARLGLFRSEDDVAGYQALLAQLERAHADDPEVALISGFSAQRDARWRDAMAAFQRATVSENTESQFYWNALYQIGRTAVLSQQSLDLGIEALRHYIEGNPREPGLPSHEWAYARMAQLLKLQGDEEAMQDAVAIAKGSSDQKLRDLLDAL